MDLKNIAKKAQKSKFWLWVLNKGLVFAIPFNKSHKLTILEIGDTYIKTMMPLCRSNKNHLNSMHACALATIGEFTGGALLVSRLGIDNYRFILKALHMEYWYQAKTHVIATFQITEQEIQEQYITPLETHGGIECQLQIVLQDMNLKDIARATSTWQIKTWDQVKTKK